jgi:hypothetical protein
MWRLFQNTISVSAHPRAARAETAAARCTSAFRESHPAVARSSIPMALRLLIPTGTPASRAIPVAGKAAWKCATTANGMTSDAILRDSSCARSLPASKRCHLPPRRQRRLQPRLPRLPSRSTTARAVSRCLSNRAIASMTVLIHTKTSVSNAGDGATETGMRPRSATPQRMTSLAVSLKA